MRTSSIDIVILELLHAQHAHMTAHQVYEHVVDRLPAVNPSTVYRALERLAQQGKVSISDMGKGAAVYEAVAGAIHHHLVCQKCGAVYTLSHADVARFFAEFEQQSNYQITTNHLVLFGVCARCQNGGAV